MYWVILNQSIRKLMRCIPIIFIFALFTLYLFACSPNAPTEIDIAYSLNKQANLYDDQGRYAEAEPLYKRALAIREKILGPVLYDKNSILIGEWKNGKIHGQGTLTSESSVTVGQFKEGKRWNTKNYYRRLLFEKYENGVLVCDGSYSDKKTSTQPLCPKEYSGPHK